MTWKEDALRRRMVRQGGPTREPRKTKKKRQTKKPWKVMKYSPLFDLGIREEKEYCCYRASTEQQCKNWIEKKRRGYVFPPPLSKLNEYRIIGPDNA